MTVGALHEGYLSGYPDTQTPSRPKPDVSYINTKASSYCTPYATPPSSAHDGRCGSYSQLAWDHAPRMQRVPITAHNNTSIHCTSMETLIIDQHNDMQIRLRGDFDATSGSMLPTPSTASFSQPSCFDETDYLYSSPQSSPVNQMWGQQELITQPNVNMSFSSSFTDAMDNVNMAASTSSSFSSYCNVSAASHSPSFVSVDNLHMSCSMSGETIPPYLPTQPIIPSTILPFDILSSQDTSQDLSSGWGDANPTHSTMDSLSSLMSTSAKQSWSNVLIHNPPVSSTIKAEHSPSRPVSPLNLPVCRTAIFQARRTKKQKKRRQRMHTVDLYNITVEMEPSVFGPSNPDTKQRPKYVCRTCDQALDRSEHLKRHEDTTHSGKRPHKCYFAECTAGKNKDGTCNRKDNSGDHLYTHLKHGVRLSNEMAELWGHCKVKKGRNPPKTPQEMRRAVLIHESKEEAAKIFDRFDRKAGRDFGTHIDFAKEWTPLSKCAGLGACGVCKPDNKMGKGPKVMARL